MALDSKFSSSFIPKAPVVGKSMGGVEKKEGFNFFGILAALIFFGSLLGFGGVFAYKTIVENSIKALESDLATAEASLDKPGIENLSNFDKRIKAIKGIIANHVAVSGYLTTIEENTVSDITFKSLKYSSPTSGGNINFSLDGKAASYAVIAQQEAVLLANPDTVSATFENLSLDRESGGVSFILKGVFKGNVVKFVDLIPKT